MTGASVNFKNVTNVSHAITHTSRTISPSYLLPAELSYGTICVLDDGGQVAKIHEQKLALASSQALRSKGYSPVWEGIMNLPRPALNNKSFNASKYKKECEEITKSWIEKYQETTGHKVLRCDIHLDEGHIDDGEVLLNAHAHIIADRTNDKGKVIKLVPKQLRDLQTLTAEVTGLERGESSYKTGRKHIGHHQYKALAEKGRLEVQQVKSQLVDERQANELFAGTVESLKAKYAADRAALKASGEATQKQYQALKLAHEAALAELAASKLEAKETTVKLEALTKRHDAFKTKAQAVVDQVVTEANKKVDEMKKEIVEKDAELVDVKAKFAAMAKDYQADKAKGTPAHLIVPGAPVQPAEQAKAPTEPTKTAPKPVFSPSLGNSILKPEKSLTERLSESWDRFVAWIKGEGGKQEPVTAASFHSGPVVQLDDLHAVQRVGVGKFAIHQLDHLDKVPDLNDPKMEIKYQDGVGQVKAEAGQEPRPRMR